MGTWSVDVFGNDDACDWIYDLEDTADISFVEETLAKVARIGSSYLEAPEAAQALAAAEVIARIQGNLGIPDEHRQIVDRWLESNTFEITEPLCRLAHAAIDRILSEPSELLELWQESADLDAWRQSVFDLKSRISCTG